MIDLRRPPWMKDAACLDTEESPASGRVVDVLLAANKWRQEESDRIREDKKKRHALQGRKPPAVDEPDAHPQLETITALMFADHKSTQVFARQVCHLCDVQDECRQMAHETRVDFGVWGGDTAEDLRKERRRRVDAYRREREAVLREAALGIQKLNFG